MNRTKKPGAATAAAADADLPPSLWIWHSLGRTGRWLPQALMSELGCAEPLIEPFGDAGPHHLLRREWRTDMPRESDEKRLRAALADRRAVSQQVDDVDAGFLNALVAEAGRGPRCHLIVCLGDSTHRLADRLAGLTERPAVATLLQQDRAGIENLAYVEVALRQGGRAVHRLALEELAVDGGVDTPAWQALRAFLGVANRPGIVAGAGASWPTRLQRELQETGAALDPKWRDLLARETRWIAGMDLPPATLAPVVRAAAGDGQPIRLVKIDRLPAVLREGDVIRLSGAVVPVGAASPQRKLLLRHGEHRQRLAWGQDSPGVAARLPGESAAARARFKPVALPVSRRRPVSLSYCAEPGAKPVPVAELAFEPHGREAIEGIYIAPWSIGYQPIPKAACTSIKEMLFRMTVGEPFSSSLAEGARHVHTYFTQRRRDVSAAAFRFVVVRDPIKRFLSAYSSRVLRHKELSRAKLLNTPLDPALDLDDFPFDPDLTTFVDRFDLYRRIPTIAHHCQPISEFLAPLSAFDKVYPFEHLRELAGDLQRLTGVAAELPHSQRAHRIALADVPPRIFDKLVQLCASDYEMLAGLYSPAQLR